MLLNLRISLKVILSFTLLLLVMVTLVGTLVYQRNSATLLDRELSILSMQSEQYHRTINSHIDNIVSDVNFISSIPPIAGIIRAINAGGADPVADRKLKEWKSHLSDVFYTILVTHPSYFQVRFIGLDDNGKEIVRVDRVNGQVIPIAEEDLQQKGHRDYFQSTIALDPGQIYLSEINLNREHGEISQPVTRTMRLAAPVFDPDNQRLFGIVIINVDVGPILDLLESLVEYPSQVFLVNGNNDFLIHPDHAKSFGFEYGKRYLLQDEMPEYANIRELIPLDKQGSRARVIENDDNILIASTLKLYLEGNSSQDKNLLLILKVPTVAALAEIHNIRNHSIVLTLVLLIVGIFSILLFTRRLLRPLETITREVENYRSGIINLVQIEDQKDELGTLASAFHSMTERISSQNFRLAERERRLTAVMDSAVDCIAIIDNKGIIDSINPAVTTLLGYARDELIGKNIKLLAAPPHDDKHDTYISNYLNGGNPHVLGYGREVMAQHKNGSLIPVLLSVGEFSVGARHYFSGIMRDIRPQKEVEQQLRQHKLELEGRVKQRTKELTTVNIQLQEEINLHKKTNQKLNLYGKIFENTQEGIMVTDASRKIVEVNDAFTRITGWSREEIIGQSLEILRSKYHDDAFYEKIRLQLINHGFWSGEIWEKHRNGTAQPKWLSINSVTNEEGKVTQYVSIFSDITELKETEKKLERLAYNDPLTNLPNRSMLNVLLDMKIGKQTREGGNLALLFIDLDRFKYVNDTLGHSMGDTLLQEISLRLKNCVRQSDLVARQGGDEFVVVMEDVDREGISTVADKIIKQVSEVVLLGENKAYVGASIGISIYPLDGKDVETLTKSADIAMYQAKEAGRNQYCFFDAKMNESSNRRLELEHALRDAIEREEFFLLYQPKVDLLSGKMCGVEALVRWEHATHGVISPDEFISIAEDTGLIIPLGAWVMKTACNQATQWLAEKPESPLRLSVNLSMRQFQSEELHDMVQQALQESGLPAHLLELEITESMLISDINKTVSILTELRKLGLSISIDDFGTGYSSLSYLKRLPIQHLKIDRTFVRDIAHDEDDAAIIRAIISLGNSLDLNIVAEGVENEHQLNHLRELACDEYQGFHFSKPVTADIISRILNDE